MYMTKLNLFQTEVQKADGMGKVSDILGQTKQQKCAK